MAASSTLPGDIAQSHKNNNNPLMPEEEEGDDNSLQICANQNQNNLPSALDYDDFPLDEDDEEFKDDYFDTYSLDDNANSNNNNAAQQWVQLLNLPPTINTSNTTGVPVGGMRRVSSCYFSIASNLSTGNNNENHSSPDASHLGAYASAFATPNTSYHRSSSYHYDALSFDGRNASDFLLHDVLMNVFSFLDAHALAAFSETGRRPNFEVFYFLELQLQRALLIGEGHHCSLMMNGSSLEEEGEEEEDDEREDNDEEGGSDDASDIEENDSVGDNHSKNRKGSSSSSVLPTFDGSIAGTGVISRLASLDSASARKIVQTYLDSNTSIHSMPLSHSLAYFRQVLLRGHPSAAPGHPFSKNHPHPPNLPNIPENMAKNARNMALFFTFLGAAYMHAQQGDAAAVPTQMMPPITMPDPLEVLNEENMEALKNMMLKVGLAGGFFKAGKTMKEKRQEQQQQQQQQQGQHANGRNENDPGLEGQHQQLQLREDGQDGQAIDHGQEATNSTNNDAGLSCSETDNDSSAIHRARSSQQRSSSIGSLEDISHMMHPSAIASRLYNAFSNTNHAPNTIMATESATEGDASSNSLTANLHPGNDRSDGLGTSLYDNAPSTTPKRQHRSKRSHETLRRHPAGNIGSEKINNPKTEGAGNWEEKKTSDAALESLKTLEGAKDAIDEQHQRQDMTSAGTCLDMYEEHKSEHEPSPEEVAYAMEHPFSPNPYDHPSSSTLFAMATADGRVSFGPTSNNNNNNAAASFFSFNATPSSDSSSQQLPIDSGNVPTGCVGAYAHAVKTAASELSSIVKSTRKSAFDALSPEEQLVIGNRFIEACTSDDKLPIVKEILYHQGKSMDVDRFFIGPDDTETCALHAAAFNGAEAVLQFLCGGIDERDPGEDCGLCDVNVKDANGWTALHFAAGANSVTSVRVLSGHGAKLAVEASNGYTPFHWAERLSNEEVAAELERLGADNRFVSRWVFGGGGGNSGTTGDGAMGGEDGRIPFVSFLANRFFAFSR